MRWLGGLLLLLSLAVGAEERVKVCFNYSCAAQAEVTFSDGQLGEVRAMLATSRTPAAERQAIGLVVGRLLGWAGEQSPIAADRGGNVADAGVSGGMDCIDHSTTTTRLLQLIERQGWLRFHRVGEIVLRRRFLLFDHYSARLDERATETPASDGETVGSGSYVVDSWFFDNGHPATIMSLEEWQAGAYPDGYE